MFSKIQRRLRRSSRQKASSNIPSEGSASGTQPRNTVADRHQDLGLDVVFEGKDPIIDIVAVHGLNGHRQKTWTASNKVHWLRDLLPDDAPRARIMCWGYDAKTHGGSQMSCQYLYDHGRTLVSDLWRKRRLDSSTRRPIIFVAHSLGGIIVKSALIHSDTSRQGALPEHRSIKVSTYGIIFMGTPHQGGNAVQLGQLLINVASVFVAADDHLLKHLEWHSEWLQQQLGQYAPISNEFVTKFAYEEYKTPTKLGAKILVVPRASAVVPGQADAEAVVIHADHMNMVKFLSKDDTSYRAISEHLQIMMTDGVDKIQSRWEEEARIAEARNDPSFGKWSLPLSLSEIAEVPHFIAREGELAQIHQVLRKIDGRRTVILQGLGGMGKTQLAIAYAKRHCMDHSAIIWLNAKDEMSLKQTFARAADRILRHHPSTAYIQNAITDKDLNQIVQAVRRWLGEARNKHWLAIYDNYDEPRFSGTASSEDNTGTEGEVIEAETDMPTEKGFDIRPFFPDTYQGAIIITTRSSAVKFGKVIRLEKLRNIHDSLQILASTSNRQGLEDDEAARKLAQRLDGLPLALSTAGSYLDQVATSWSEYLELYETSWLRLQEATPQLPAYDYAMFSTWDISYRHIERQDKKAAKLLKLWAHFDNEDLWFELLESGRSNSKDWMLDLTQDRLSFDQTMRVLCSHGLAGVDPSTKRTGTQSPGYSAHGCVHSWMVHVLNMETSEDMSLLAMECVASHAPSNTVEEYWLLQRRLLRHADRCFVTLQKHDRSQEDERICAALGFLYADQGRFGDAEAMYERALRGKEKAWGPEHTETLDTINNLGNLYKNQGRFGDAEAMYERALRGKEKAWGPEHTSTLDTVNNLGNLYADQGRFGDAEAMYERALRGKEKAWGPEHTSTLNTVNNLGNLYKTQGRFGDAEAMYERALRGYEKAWGPEHTSTLDTVNNLGLLYKTQGRFGDAEAMYERALRGYEKAWGPEHTSTLDTVNNLGSLYKTQGRFGDAEAMYERALRGKEKAWGPEHTSTLAIVNNLGILYADQGRFGDAEAMYERALRGKEKAWGPEHTSTLDTVNNLGILYKNQGRFGDAEAMYERALRGYENALNDSMVKTYPPALNALENLGNLLDRLGRAPEAQEYYIRAEAGIRVVFGPSSERHQRIVSKLRPA